MAASFVGSPAWETSRSWVSGVLFSTLLACATIKRRGIHRLMNCFQTSTLIFIPGEAKDSPGMKKYILNSN